MLLPYTVGVALAIQLIMKGMQMRAKLSGTILASRNGATIGNGTLTNTLIMWGTPRTRTI